MGNKTSVKPKARPDIIGASNSALMEFWMEIPDTPQALLVVVATTYSTWHLRTTYVEGPAERRQSRPTAKSSSREDEINDHIHWKHYRRACRRWVTEEELLFGEREGRM